MIGQKDHIDYHSCFRQPLPSPNTLHPMEIQDHKYGDLETINV